MPSACVILDLHVQTMLAYDAIFERMGKTFLLAHIRLNGDSVLCVFVCCSLAAEHVSRHFVYAVFDFMHAITFWNFFTYVLIIL